MEPAPSRAWARRQVVERLSLQKCRRLLTESRSELGAQLDIQTAAGRRGAWCRGEMSQRNHVSDSV
jgi:hypothetical protein